MHTYKQRVVGYYDLFIMRLEDNVPLHLESHCMKQESLLRCV